MCFSPEADVVAGVVIGAAGIDALRNARERAPVRQARRWIQVSALAAGVVTATMLAAALVRGPVTVRAEHDHVVYNVDLWAGPVVVALYLFATCGAFGVSGQRFLRWFGAANLAAVAVVHGSPRTR